MMTILFWAIWWNIIHWSSGLQEDLTQPSTIDHQDNRKITHPPTIDHQDNRKISPIRPPFIIRTTDRSHLTAHHWSSGQQEDLTQPPTIDHQDYRKISPIPHHWSSGLQEDHQSATIDYQDYRNISPNRPPLIIRTTGRSHPSAHHWSSGL